LALSPAGRLMPDNFLHLQENKLSETGIAYFQRLPPQKFTAAKPFVG
jgi:ATP-dependent phosphofructokinase / diphosphate-dependent phosphofructokinase